MCFRTQSFDMSDTELVIPSRDIPDGRKHVSIICAQYDSVFVY